MNQFLEQSLLGQITKRKYKQKIKFFKSLLFGKLFMMHLLAKTIVFIVFEVSVDQDYDEIN